MANFLIRFAASQLRVIHGNSQSSDSATFSLPGEKRISSKLKAENKFKTLPKKHMNPSTTFPNFNYTENVN